MSWWIIGTAHLLPKFVGWDRGEDHAAFGYFGVVNAAQTEETGGR